MNALVAMLAAYNIETVLTGMPKSNTQINGMADTLGFVQIYETAQMRYCYISIDQLRRFK